MDEFLDFIKELNKINYRLTGDLDTLSVEEALVLLDTLSSKSSEVAMMLRLGLLRPSNKSKQKQTEKQNERETKEVYST